MYYAGCLQTKRSIDINSRISIPGRIRKSDSKKLISLLNDVLIEICEVKILQEDYFGIEEMDKVIDENLLARLKEWKFKSGIKSRKWFTEWT
jgi:hypothetical protein